MQNELTTLQAILNEALDELGVAHEDEHYVWAGGHEYRLDCYLPDFYAYIEADGPFIHHSLRADRKRDDNLERLGLRGLHVAWELLTTSSKAEILQLLTHFLDGVSHIKERREKGRQTDAFKEITGD